MQRGREQEGARGGEPPALRPAASGDAAPEPFIDRTAERARAYARAAKAPSTLRAYRADWRDFTLWCEGRGTQALPATPETVALYLADRAETHRPATLARRLAAIAKTHAAAGHPSPASLSHLAVGETLKGIRRTHGVAQQAKLPLVTADIQKLLAHLPGEGGGGKGALAAARDRALLLLGYAGAFRRSELAALRVGDLLWVEEGLAVRIARSKTDQKGEGRKVALPCGQHPASCPVRALEAWLTSAGIDRAAAQAPLFRAVDRHGRLLAAALHPNSVGEIVKRALRRAGYPDEAYGGHSLRAGFATQAARSGASAFAIMRQTGHRSVATVARYVREAELFRDTPAGRLGL